MPQAAHHCVLQEGQIKQTACQIAPNGDLPPGLCGSLYFQRGVKHLPLDAELANSCSSMSWVVWCRQACSGSVVSES